MHEIRSSLMLAVFFRLENRNKCPIDLEKFLAERNRCKLVLWIFNHVHYATLPETATITNEQPQKPMADIYISQQATPKTTGKTINFAHLIDNICL